MTRFTVSTERAPQPVGPYSQAIGNDGWLHLAGQIGLDVVDGRLVGGGTAGEAAQAIKNIGAILSAAGGGWEDVSAVTVYLVDEDDFACFNGIYEAHLPAGVKPARTTVIVKALPLGAKVEMTAVARLSGGASKSQDG